MPNEGANKDFDIMRLYADIENELTANTLKSQDPVIQKTIKMCVFHIILKAIALSKDPKADKQAIKALYESAKEIIVNSTLDEDESTHNRLQDLINSMIDGDDISAQLKSYTMANRQWMDSKIMFLEAKLSSISTKSSAIEILLKELKTNVKSGGKAPTNYLGVLGMGLLAMLFTIITSVAIISFVLTSAINNEALTNSQQIEKYIQENKR